jgi:hypothetical protein
LTSPATDHSRFRPGSAKAAQHAEAHQLPEYAAGVLRWRRVDLEEPPLDVVPAGAPIMAALARRDRALDAAERAWEGLPAGARDALRPPGELLEEVGWA